MLLLFGYQQAIAGIPYESIGGQAMGTTYVVKVANRPTAVSLDELKLEIQKELDRIEQVFSLFRSTSELSRFNASQSASWIKVSADLHGLLRQALKLAEQTGGAFDPTVGPLVRLWKINSLAADWEPPPLETIAAARQHVGYRLIEIRDDPRSVRKASIGVELDLNALVEGWAIDRVVDLLRRHELPNVLVEFGGEFRGLGHRGDGQPWRIGVEDPHEVGSCFATVALDSEALATSGDYRQAMRHAGKSYLHIIDPRTGAPIQHGLSAVSVIATDALTADGWATALLVLGPAEGRQLAEEHQLAASFAFRNAQSVPAFTPAARGLFEVTRVPAQSSTPAAHKHPWLGYGFAGLVFYLMLLGAARRLWRSISRKSARPATVSDYGPTRR